MKILVEDSSGVKEFDVSDPSEIPIPTSIRDLQERVAAAVASVIGHPPNKHQVAIARDCDRSLSPYKFRHYVLLSREISRLVGETIEAKFSSEMNWISLHPKFR